MDCFGAAPVGLPSPRLPILADESESRWGAMCDWRDYDKLYAH